MNRINICTLLFVIISFHLSAQNAYNGIRTSKRAGILGATINPAELANMPQKVDSPRQVFPPDLPIFENAP